MPTNFSLKTIIDKMMKLRIITDKQCWELKNEFHNPKGWGYSKIKCFGSYFYAHRISAAYYHSMNLEDSKQLALHKNNCHNRACWNPEHVYVGDRYDNMQDRVDRGDHWNARKTHCKEGHPLVIKYGKRFCIVCKRKTQKEWREKNETRRTGKIVRVRIHPVTGRKLENGCD